MSWTHYVFFLKVVCLKVVFFVITNVKKMCVKKKLTETKCLENIVIEPCTDSLTGSAESLWQRCSPHQNDNMSAVRSRCSSSSCFSLSVLYVCCSLFLSVCIHVPHCPFWPHLYPCHLPDVMSQYSHQGWDLNWQFNVFKDDKCATRSSHKVYCFVPLKLQCDFMASVAVYIERFVDVKMK